MVPRSLVVRSAGCSSNVLSNTSDDLRALRRTVRGAVVERFTGSSRTVHDPPCRTVHDGPLKNSWLVVRGTFDGTLVGCAAESLRTVKVGLQGIGLTSSCPSSSIYANLQESLRRGKTYEVRPSLQHRAHDEKPFAAVIPTG